jgi:hypothetical protein
MRRSSSKAEELLATTKELEALCDWLEQDTAYPNASELASAVRKHLSAAREALTRRRFLTAAAFERATSNIDAATSQLLLIAPDGYVRSQLPELVTFVRENLAPNHPARIVFEEIAGRASKGGQLRLTGKERGVVVTTIRAANSALRRTYIRLRSFRVVLYVAAACLVIIAVAAAVAAAIFPSSVALCTFADGKILCPTAAASFQGGDLNEAVAAVVSRWDFIVVEMVGLMGAAAAAAGLLRRTRNVSAPHGLPVALAFLKLPTGALTAILGVLLMRAQWLIGLSAVNTSAQILACALLFGYGQQIFTRQVDDSAAAFLGKANPETSSMRASRIVIAWSSALRSKSSDLSRRDLRSDA